jgi:hypothetical protein
MQVMIRCKLKPDQVAFQRFRSTLDERCDEPPVLTVLHEVGSYRASPDDPAAHRRRRNPPCHLPSSRQHRCG